jgi:hypothetical protein
MRTDNGTQNNVTTRVKEGSTLLDLLENQEPSEEKSVTKAQLMKECGISESTVRRTLEALKIDVDQPFYNEYEHELFLKGREAFKSGKVTKYAELRKLFIETDFLIECQLNPEETVKNREHPIFVIKQFNTIGILRG